MAGAVVPNEQGKAYYDSFVDSEDPYKSHSNGDVWNFYFPLMEDASEELYFQRHIQTNPLITEEEARLEHEAIVTNLGGILTPAGRSHCYFVMAFSTSAIAVSEAKVKREDDLYQLAKDVARTTQEAKLRAEYAKLTPAQREEERRIAAEMLASKSASSMQHSLSTVSLAAPLGKISNEVAVVRHLYTTDDGMTFVASSKTLYKLLEDNRSIIRLSTRERLSIGSSDGVFDYDVEKMKVHLFGEWSRVSRAVVIDPTDAYRNLKNKLPYLRTQPCFINKTLCDRLLRWDFRTGDQGHLFWMHVHPTPWNSSFISNRAHFEACLEYIQDMLLMFHGEAFNRFLDPLIRRIKDGDLANLLGFGTSLSQHLLLIDAIQEAFGEVGSTLRSKTALPCIPSDVNSDLYQTQIVAEMINSIMTAIPPSDNATDTASRVIAFKSTGGENVLKSFLATTTAAGGKKRGLSSTSTTDVQFPSYDTNLDHDSEEMDVPRNSVSDTERMAKRTRNQSTASSLPLIPICLANLMGQFYGRHKQSCFVHPCPIGLLHKKADNVSKDQLAAAIQNGPAIYAERWVTDDKERKLKITFGGIIVGQKPNRSQALLDVRGNNIDYSMDAVAARKAQNLQRSSSKVINKMGGVTKK